MRISSFTVVLLFVLEGAFDHFAKGTVAGSALRGICAIMGFFGRKFLPTPSAGLEDKYVKFSYTFGDAILLLGKTKIVVDYHDFKAVNGGAHYGNEFDAALIKPIGKRYSIAVHYAHYNADGFSTNARKTWVTLQAKY